MADDLVRDFARVIVQTATSLRASDGDWTSQALMRCTAASEGAGLVLGDADFEQDYGEIQQPGSRQFLQVEVAPNLSGGSAITSLAGQVMRLLVEDDDGSVLFDGLTFTPFWWGIIQDHAREHHGASEGKATWKAVGLASMLDQIVLNDGWVTSFTGSDPARPGFVPPFNHLSGGDRSTATFTVGGASVYVHDLATATTGNKWTARQILDLLLAGAARPTWPPTYAAAGFEWQVSDPDSCLTYHPEDLDLDGQTLLAAVNTLVSAKRGLTWRVSVSGAVATINVLSTTPSAVTVGTYSLPASTAQQTLDLTDDPALSAPSINHDESTTYDVIELRGARPWVALTLDYDGTGSVALLGSTFGWTAAAETLWDDDNEASLTEHVWRRFQVRTAWNGHQYNDTAHGLRDTPTTSASGDYGAGGMTGDRTFTGGANGPIPPAWMCKVERMLPCSAMFGTDRLGPRQQPVVVIYDGTDYTDVSKVRQVQLEEFPPAVVMDDGANGITNQADLDDSGPKLLVTMAFREVMPLRVSWQRAQQQWPRETPRVKTIHLNHIEQHVVLAGTVKGVTDVGALDTLTDDLVVRDDVPAMRGLLALARAYYAVPAVTVQWTVRGELDIAATYIPGTLLTVITHGGTTTTANSVITRRSWRLVFENDVERWDTTYHAERLTADVEAIV